MERLSSFDLPLAYPLLPRVFHPRKIRDSAGSANVRRGTHCCSRPLHFSNIPTTRPPPDILSVPDPSTSLHFRNRCDDRNDLLSQERMGRQVVYHRNWNHLALNLTIRDLLL